MNSNDFFLIRSFLILTQNITYLSAVKCIEANPSWTKCTDMLLLSTHMYPIKLPALSILSTSISTSRCITISLTWRRHSSPWASPLTTWTQQVVYVKRFSFYAITISPTLLEGGGLRRFTFCWRVSVKTSGNPFFLEKHYQMLSFFI